MLGPSVSAAGWLTTSVVIALGRSGAAGWERERERQREAGSGKRRYKTLLGTDDGSLAIEGTEPEQVTDMVPFTREPRLGVGGEPCRQATGVVLHRRVLFDRLSGASRVTQVTAPPGSGKTLLLRPWIGEAGLAEDAGWVSVQRGGARWPAVLDLGHRGAGYHRCRGDAGAGPDAGGQALLGLFVAVGFAISPTGWDNLIGRAGATVAVGQAIQLIGVLTALVAGLVATGNGYRQQVPP